MRSIQGRLDVMGAFSQQIDERDPIMPRQRPVRPALPLQEDVPTPTPPIDDPVYRALLAAEATAYAAWLSYAPTKQRETKDELDALRRTYEQKRAERRAYRPPDPPELITRPGTLPWQ